MTRKDRLLSSICEQAFRVFPRRAPTMEGLKQVSRAISDDHLTLALRRIDKLSANTSKGVTERRKAVHTALAGGRHE